jgi:hypothetical protein
MAGLAIGGWDRARSLRSGARPVLKMRDKLRASTASRRRAPGRWPADGPRTGREWLFLPMPRETLAGTMPGLPTPTPAHVMRSLIRTNFHLPRSLAPVIALCLLGGVLWVGSAYAQTAAQPSQRRLQMTIETLRQGGTQLGADQGRGRLAEQLTLSALLQSDGTPSPSNKLDPDDTRRQMERAQRTQQRVQSALNRQGSATPAAMPSDRGGAVETP